MITTPTVCLNKDIAQQLSHAQIATVCCCLERSYDEMIFSVTPVSEISLEG